MFVFLPRGGKGVVEAFCPTFCASLPPLPFTCQYLTSLSCQNHKTSAESSTLSKRRLKDSED